VQPIQLREVFGFGYAVGVQRKEDACFLFSQVQSFKNGIAHLLRTVCADTERKGDYRFKAVNLHAALVGQSDGMPYLTLIQNAVLARLYLRKEKTSIFFSLNTNGIAKAEYFS
jgi:hypothetical protein